MIVESPLSFIANAVDFTNGNFTDSTGTSTPLEAEMRRFSMLRRNSMPSCWNHSPQLQQWQQYLLSIGRHFCPLAPRLEGRGSCPLPPVPSWLHAALPLVCRCSFTFPRRHLLSWLQEATNCAVAMRGFPKLVLTLSEVKKVTHDCYKRLIKGYFCLEGLSNYFKNNFLVKLIFYDRYSMS